MMMDDEWLDYIEAQKVSPKTVKAYTINYNKLIDGLDKSVTKSTQRDILELIDELTDVPNTASALMNVAIQVRRFYDASVDKLVNARERMKIKIDERRDIINKGKLEDLPSFQDLKRHINNLYSEQKYRDFLINWLLLNYNTRNQDLQLSIVSSKKEANDLTKNYLVLRPGGTMMYIRRNYKTFQTYGPKSFTFKNAKVMRAAKAFVEEKGGFGDGPVHLLSTGANKQIDDSSIQKFIRKRTLNGISEGDVNKIVVSMVDNIKDFKLLKIVSDRRGTSIENLITQYHLSFPLV